MQTVAYPWMLAVADVVAAILYLFIGLSILVVTKRLMHATTYLPAHDRVAKQPKYLHELNQRIEALKKES